MTSISSILTPSTIMALFDNSTHVFDRYGNILFDHTPFETKQKMPKEEDNFYIESFGSKPLTLALPLYGYISPFLILIILLTNSLIIVILLRSNMISPTNVLLAAMALADMLTAISPLPWFIYYYAAQRYKYPIGVAWCKVHDYSTIYLPTIFHTASVWLVLSLAVHRYICVCRTVNPPLLTKMRLARQQISQIVKNQAQGPNKYGADYRCENITDDRARITNSVQLDPLIINSLSPTSDPKPWWKVPLNFFTRKSMVVDQRSNSISYSLTKYYWRSLKTIFYVITFIMTLSILYNLPRFYEHEYVPVVLRWQSRGVVPAKIRLYPSDIKVFQIKETKFNKITTSNNYRVSKVLYNLTVPNSAISSGEINEDDKHLVLGEEINVDKKLLNIFFKGRPINLQHFGVFLSTKNHTDIFQSGEIHCAYRYPSWILGWKNLYFNFYFWFRVIFVHLVPCTIMVVLNTVLISTLRRTQFRTRKDKNYDTQNEPEAPLLKSENDDAKRLSLKNTKSSIGGFIMRKSIKFKRPLYHHKQIDTLHNCHETIELKNNWQKLRELEGVNDTRCVTLPSGSNNNQNNYTAINKLVASSGSQAKIECDVEGFKENVIDKVTLQKSPQHSVLPIADSFKVVPMSMQKNDTPPPIAKVNPASLPPVEAKIMESKVRSLRKIKQTKQTTSMLIVVVSLALIVEIPVGLLFICHILDNTFKLGIINYEIAQAVGCIMDFAILASYPFNFVIYCLMSHHFRENFKGILSRFRQRCCNLIAIPFAKCRTFKS